MWRKKTQLLVNWDLDTLLNSALQPEICINNTAQAEPTYHNNTDEIEISTALAE